MPEPSKKTNLMIRFCDKGLFIMKIHKKDIFHHHQPQQQHPSTVPFFLVCLSDVDFSSAAFSEMLMLLSVLAAEKKSSVLNLRMLHGELVTSLITPVFLSISNRRLPGSAGFTITFMLPARDSDVLSLSADWVSLC